MSDPDSRIMIARVPPEQSMQPAPQSNIPSPPAKLTTRSGCRVRFPARFNVCVSFSAGGDWGTHTLTVGLPHKPFANPFQGPAHHLYKSTRGPFPSPAFPTNHTSAYSDQSHDTPNTGPNKRCEKAMECRCYWHPCLPGLVAGVLPRWSDGTTQEWEFDGRPINSGRVPSCGQCTADPWWERWCEFSHLHAPRGTLCAASGKEHR